MDRVCSCIPGILFAQSVKDRGGNFEKILFDLGDMETKQGQLPALAAAWWRGSPGAATLGL